VIAERAQRVYQLGGIQSGVNFRENLQVRPNQIAQGYTLVIKDKQGVLLVSSPIFQDLFGKYWHLENESLSSAAKTAYTPVTGNNATLPRDSNTTKADQNATQTDRNATVPPDRNTTTFPDRNATTLPDRNATTPPGGNRTKTEANGTAP
ncbi:MAG: hypothetical protein QF685_12260, partial [Verrucomicrobiota bacterium]|nr:hypothetical protein [Verrucomicrobiota bacterium]